MRCVDLLLLLGEDCAHLLIRDRNSGLSETPPGMHDLLYWTVLQLNTNGAVKQVPYQKEISFQI